MMANRANDFPAVQQTEGDLFARIVAPLNRELFLTEYFGKSFVHLPGTVGRFQYLLPWEKLNSILEQYRLRPPRLKLVRDGALIDPKLFMSGSRFRSKLNSSGFMNCLAEGATLVINNIDELVPAVGDLAEKFQEALRSPTSVNLYAGWRTQKGFDLHWDSQDTMILQVSGRKRWMVYPPTRLHPLKIDIEAVVRPSGNAVWEGILEEGEAIYLPRGWWHVALPLDEPSLHLTVTVVPETGADFLGWVVDRLKRHEEVRMNVPHLANASERGRYVARLQTLLIDFLNQDALERFITEREIDIPLRPRVDLPLDPTTALAPMTMETRLRLVSSRRITFNSAPTEGTVYMAMGGIQAECSPDLIPALEKLNGFVSCSVRELCSQLPDQTMTAKLYIILTALVMRGVLQREN